MNLEETIAAISTPLGEGGIGIVRLSGDSAVPIADALFRASTGESLAALPTHTLRHGFIDAKRLESVERRTALRTSDLIRVIMGIPNVRAVKHLRLRSGSREGRWWLDLDPEKAPRLHIRGSRFRLTRGQVTTAVDQAAARDIYLDTLRRSVGFRERRLDERDLLRRLAHDP